MKNSEEKLVAFAKACIRSVFAGGVLSGSEMLDLAIEHGLLETVKFDPEKHEDEYGYAEPGDDWFVMADFMK